MKEDVPQLPESKTSALKRTLLVAGTLIYFSGLIDLTHQLAINSEINPLKLSNYRFVIDSLIIGFGMAMLNDSIEITPMARLEGKYKTLIFASCLITATAGAILYFNDFYHGRALTFDYYESISSKLNLILMATVLYPTLVIYRYDSNK